MICRYCDNIVPPKRVSLGYNYCIDCSTEQRYVGRRNDKHGDVVIFRENQQYFKQQLKRENRVCYNANLPFNSPSNPFINHNDMERHWLVKDKLKRDKKGGEK